VGIEACTFATVEPYERGYQVCTGTATVSLDPEAPANQVIVDLGYSPRSSDGLVRFDTDVVLVQAPNPTGLLHVVANRGLATALPYGVGMPLAPYTGRVEAGDGWVLDRGLSVLWVGWQWDVNRRPGAVGLDVPQAVGPDGRPISGQARFAFQPVVETDTQRLSDIVLAPMGEFRPYPAADLEEPTARLTDGAWFNGPRREISRDRWRFVDAEHIQLDGGFAPGSHYELTYTTNRCPVVGAGLAAVRDVIAHLRTDYAYTLAFGSSQSGRWLRQFVYDTGNADEHGRKVFDGVHCHIAGGRRGEFNHRYARPSTMMALGFSHLPPFSPSDGLLDRATASATRPRIVFTNTSTEYWRGDASLVHPDGDGRDWRVYLYAGAHHSGQMPGYVEALPVQLAPNLVDITLSTRAHFAALEAWVRDGVEPPDSAVPKLEFGTAATRESVLEVVSAPDGTEWPSVEALPGMPPIDLGDQTAAGIGRFPATVIGPARRCVVSSVDADGNELAGVRLAHVAVPLDVSLGWNPERPRHGVPVEIWNLVGGRIPFSTEEIWRRYGSKAEYLHRVRAAVDELVRARHLLVADAEASIADAARRWDAAVEAPSSN
jgi:hypothetical protein